MYQEYTIAQSTFKCYKLIFSDEKKKDYKNDFG